MKLTNFQIKNYKVIHNTKNDEAANIWQARINDHYRFYFQIHEPHDRDW